MKRLIVAAALAGALAGCGNPAEESDEPEAATAAATPAATPTSSAGTYEVTLADGSTFTATLKPDGIGEAEDDNGSGEPAHRYLETLPGGVTHKIFKMYDNGRLDNTAEVTVPPGHIFVMGDNRDNSADSRVPVSQGGVDLLPTDDLVGRVDAIVGSWDMGVRNQPIWDWPSGLRLSRFFNGEPGAPAVLARRAF